MTQNEIIEMAREAASHGVENHRSGEVSYVFYNEHLMNFAKLVEDKVRQEIIEKNAPVIKKVNEHIKELQDAVKAEREACAKICEELGAKDDSFYAEFSRSDDCANAIRARGNT